jgi:hypothetical protein
VSVVNLNLAGWKSHPEAVICESTFPSPQTHIDDLKVVVSDGSNIHAARGWGRRDPMRRKLGSERVKTLFFVMYFLIAMNSHACFSGASLADMHLAGYASHWACISQDRREGHLDCRWAMIQCSALQCSNRQNRDLCIQRRSTP